MYAIVEIAGQQFKVERGHKVYVHRLEANEGANVEFDKVLLMDDGGSITLGSPTVEGARVAATIISHLRGDKVIIFKKQRRKGTQKWNNHRQSLTQILIQGVLPKGETLKDELKVEKREKFVSGRRSNQTNSVQDVQFEEEVAVKPAKKVSAKSATKAAVKKAPTKKASKKKD
jgi:large subunit ribosomal protein L21